jgi:hypothetical protein
MLGISRGAFVSLTKNGFEFYLGGDLVLAVHGEIHGHFKGLRDMAAGGSLDIKVGTIDLGALGKIPINTGVKGKLDIKVDQESVSVTFDAEFEFAGETHEIAKFDLDISEKTLENLVSTLANKIKDALLEILKDGLKWAEYVAKGFIEEVEDVAKVLAEVFGLIDNAIWGHSGQEVTVIRELLTKSQAATIEVTVGTPAPSQAIIDEVTAWAKQMQERAILNYVAAANQAKANLPDDATKYVMGYVNSFAVTYEESQVVDWIFNAKQNLPPLTDFNTKYYRKVLQERLFNVLVKTDVDFNTTVNDLTVTINYPNLSPSSFRFTSSDQQHLFTAAWDATQAAEYELQYTVTFKDGSPAFTSPPVNQVDTNITLSPAKIGIQSVLFDASTIDFGTGEGKVDRVDITVKFSGDADTPTKVVSLSANQKVATVKSTYRVPVANVYTYTATYYQNGQIVYTTPEIPNTNVTQAIYNPLIARDVEFQGAGFESGLQMINLTVGTRSIQLTPQQPSQTIPYVFTPGSHMITYRGTMATSQGPVPIPETTRPASSVITVGVNVPQWFSVTINSSLIQWADISAIAVELSKGTLSSHGDSVSKTILPTDSAPSYWGFDYTDTDGSPHYCWAATYYYKDGNKKTTELSEVGSTILTLPQNPDLV